MQNPSDPGAGYDGHKGPGYQLQVLAFHQGGPTSVSAGDFNPSIVIWVKSIMH